MSRASRLALLLTLPCAWSWSPAPVVQTTYGPVVGTLLPSGTCRYLGIPFAAPPVGALRFAAPLPPTPWTQTLNASAVRAWCVQFPGDGPVTPVPEAEVRASHAVHVAGVGGPTVRTRCGVAVTVGPQSTRVRHPWRDPIG